MNFNPKIAAAIAAVLGVGAAGAASAAVPTVAQAAATSNVLYMSGSSAAKNAVLVALQNDMCGGSSNALTFTSTGNTNFEAVSCEPSSTTGLPGANGSTVFTVYYRFEGGSVVGALPLASGKPISQLNLNTAATTVVNANTATVAVVGSSSANGTTDSFTINGVQAPRQLSGLGLTDVEPTAFVGDNYPSAYSTAVYGKAGLSDLQGLSAFPEFQQVFAIYVNPTGFATPTAVCLSSWAVASLLNGEITDWNKVEDCATHLPVASAPLTVTLVNREAGSGSRAATSIFWLDDECNPSHSGVVEDQTVDYFSTGNVLTAASTTSGAITYSSIDQSQSPLIKASIDGVAASNLTAAQGWYQWWLEATLVLPSVYTPPAVATAIANFLITDLANGNTVPHTAQVMAIPGSGTNTTPAIPVASHPNTCSNSACSPSTSTAIYVNPFTRIGVSCNIPTSVL